MSEMLRIRWNWTSRLLMRCPWWIFSSTHSLLPGNHGGTRLILVGDENQLPSVVLVLRDIIGSKAFPVVEPQKFFRQASES